MVVGMEHDFNFKTQRKIQFFFLWKYDQTMNAKFRMKWDPFNFTSCAYVVSTNLPKRCRIRFLRKCLLKSLCIFMQIERAKKEEAIWRGITSVSLFLFNFAMWLQRVCKYTSRANTTQKKRCWCHRDIHI